MRTNNFFSYLSSVLNKRQKVRQSPPKKSDCQIQCPTCDVLHNAFALVYNSKHSVYGKVSIANWSSLRARRSSLSANSLSGSLPRTLLHTALTQDHTALTHHHTAPMHAPSHALTHHHTALTLLHTAPTHHHTACTYYHTAPTHLHTALTCHHMAPTHHHIITLTHHNTPFHGSHTQSHISALYHTLSHSSHTPSEQA